MRSTGSRSSVDDLLETVIFRRCATFLPRFAVEEVLVRSPSPAEHLLSRSCLGNRGVDVVPQLNPRPLGFHHHRILLFDPAGKSTTTKKRADLVWFNRSTHIYVAVLP